MSTGLTVTVRGKKSKNLLIPIKEEDLSRDTNLYFLEINQKSREDYIKDFGEDNIIEIPSSFLNLPPNGSVILVKSNIFKTKRKLEKDSCAKAIFTNIDFHEISEKILLSRFNNYLNSEQIWKYKVDEIYFINSYLNIISSKQFLNSNSPEFQITVSFVNCIIDIVEVNRTKGIKSNTFKNCEIRHLLQKGKDELILQNNIVNHLDANALEIKLDSVKLKLFCHHDIENVGFTLNNVKVEYDNIYIKNITRNDFKSYWNTYSKMYRLDSLASERLEIEKYINYFRSRDPNISIGERFIKMLLFWFHRGYTKLLPSLFLLILCICLNYYLLYFQLNRFDDGLILVFNPIKLFSDIILKDFAITGILSIPKFVILFSELILIFSFFTSGIVLKKLFGFKTEKVQ